MIELKYTKDKPADLERLAKQGCNQITEKQYDCGMQNVVMIGLAHRGKQVKMYGKQD